jgi:hypothetical protein
MSAEIVNKAALGSGQRKKSEDGTNRAQGANSMNKKSGEKILQ